MKKTLLKLLFIVIVLSSISKTGFAQKQLDSLKLLVLHSGKDTNRISAYIQIGDILADSIPDSASMYYNKALLLSEEIKNVPFQIQSCSSLANLNISQENYKKALDFYAKEKELCLKINDKKKLKFVVGNSGVIYFYLSNYPEALKNFFDLEKIAIELNDSDAIATAYTNIGIIFKKLDENDKALTYFNKNLSIAQKINSKSSISDSYNNIGLIFQDENKDSIAVEYFKKSLKLSKEINDEESVAISELNIGISLLNMNRMNEALSKFETALNIAEKIKNKRLTAESENELAEIYFKFSDLPDYTSSEQKKYLNKSLNYAEDSYKISKSHSYLNNVKKITHLLAKIYKKKKNSDRALKFALEHIAVKDSIFKNQNLEAIQKMNAKYEIYKNRLLLEKKESEIEQNKKLIKNKNFIIKYGIIGAVIFLFLSILLVILFIRIKKQKNKLSELKQLQDYLINNLPVSVYLKDVNFRYKLANKSFADLLGLSLTELIGKSDRELDQETKYEDIDMQVIAMNKAIKPITEKFINQEGKELWVSIKKVPFHDINGKVAGVIGIVSDVTEYTKLNFRLQKALDETRKKNKHIKQINRDINDSLIYAKTIQDAVLPCKNYLNTVLKNYFLIYRSRQIVSGDFYFVKEINETLTVALADCTGHGVPGGFLTMLSISFLHQITAENTKLIPSEILNKLRENIKVIFNTEDNQNKNGLDIALCTVDKKNQKMQFSGAYNSLFLLRNNELTEYKATRIPIGYYFAEKQFKNYEIDLKKGDIVYLFTDGFKDQIGGSENKKFTSKRLKSLILKNHKLPMDKQKEIIENTFIEWLGDNEQFDDVSMLAFKPVE